MFSRFLGVFFSEDSEDMNDAYPQFESVHRSSRIEILCLMDKRYNVIKSYVQPYIRDRKKLCFSKISGRGKPPDILFVLNKSFCPYTNRESFECKLTDGSYVWLTDDAFRRKREEMAKRYLCPIFVIERIISFDNDDENDDIVVTVKFRGFRACSRLSIDEAFDHVTKITNENFEFRFRLPIVEQIKAGYG